MDASSTPTKAPFIISALTFPRSFSKKPMPNVVLEDQLKPELQRIQEEKEEYERKMKEEKDEPMGVMDLDLEREAEAMIGATLDDVEVVAEHDSEDFEELDDEDILVVAAYNTPEISSLHCYVYQPSVANFYLQHDRLVSEHCLAVEWMNFHPYAPDNESANVVATATFDQFIEIWDMDVRDSTAPIMTLGGDEKNRVKGQHTEAILALSWHHDHRHLLASGSQDKTVKIWDLNTGAVGITLRHHKEIVHAICWNPVQSQQLLTSSFDGTTCLVDPSDPDRPIQFNYGRGRQSEEIAWRNENEFAVSCNTGHVVGFDKRQNKKPLWTFKPHASECHSIHFSSVAGSDSLLATVGADRMLHLYDVTKFAQKDVNNNQAQARLYSEDKMSALFVVRFHECHVAVGGQNLIELTDLRSLDEVRERYPQAFPLPEHAVMEDIGAGEIVEEEEEDDEDMEDEDE